MSRLTLEEREISINQSAIDRQDGKWHIWTNDNYWHRRLQRVGATVVSATESGTTYAVDLRQVLIRRVPALRQAVAGASFGKAPRLSEEEEADEADEGEEVEEVEEVEDSEGEDEDSNVTE